LIEDKRERIGVNESYTFGTAGGSDWIIISIAMMMALVISDCGVRRQNRT
jgi:hypothetical protein